MLERGRPGRATRHPAGGLTLAERKRLELARALATEPALLLLDEVMAGLNAARPSGIVELVARIHARGVAILLIEHDMRAVMRLSRPRGGPQLRRDDRRGPPAEVASDPRVIEAYLGEPRVMSPLLRLDGVEAGLRRLVAVRDVSLECRRARSSP